MIKSPRKTGAQNRSTSPSEITQDDQKPQKNRSIGAEIPSCNRKMKHTQKEELTTPWADVDMESECGVAIQFPKMNPQ